MTYDFDADLDTMYEDEDCIRYTPGAYPHESNKTVRLYGHFTYSIDLDGVITNNPIFTTKTSNFTELKSGDNVTLEKIVSDPSINETVYQVVEYHKDGSGNTALKLELQ